MSRPAEFECGPVDPHSLCDPAQGWVRRLHLDLRVDFERRQLVGTARLELDAAHEGPLDLDSRGLLVEEVTADDGRRLAFEHGAVDPVLGQRLRVHRDRPTPSVTLRYATGPGASALMWLEPAQTEGGVLPFLLSQCQAIHARSLVPLQDTPRARIAYTARLVVPESMSAVMSAAPGRREPGPEPGTASLSFEMPQAIPPYLLAIAVGDITSRDLGPRTRVYAEPATVEKAAWEFVDVERMLAAAEGLFGPYRWERYDFIVLPPSFPMGGMENPRMTFLTPTLLAGDRSLVSVLAHELAHSWTGNLVTNATNQDFWLNEGWTVYAERRILEVVYGPEEAAQSAVMGRVDLDGALRGRAEQGHDTALCYDQAGRDPDEEFSKIPYEKGFLLVSALERVVGRERFDEFVGAYMERFQFTSIDTATFARFVREQLPQAAAAVDLDEWLYGQGLPVDAPGFESPRLGELRRLALGWPEGRRPQGAERWSTTERLYYLSQLPAPTASDCDELAQSLGLRATANAELLSAWLALAARTGLLGLEDQLRGFLGRVGRTKLLTPVIRAMLQGEAYADLARSLVAEHGPRLHGSTRGALERLVAR